MTSYTYDVRGSVLTETDARGVTAYAYDDRDRLISLTYPDGRRLDYAYDPNGNRTSLTAHVGGQVLTTSYTYDDLSRLETVTDPAGKVYVHGYDANGNRQSLAHPNGVQTTYTYDTLNRLKSLVAISTATSQLVVSFAYALGPTGNRTRIVEHDGTTRNYQYDALYRLTDEHVTLAGATRWRNGFTYDPVGNRLRQDRIETSGSQRVVSYTYDGRDRLLAEESGNSTLYGWDENGNQISKSGPLGAIYEWDFENRLRKVTLASGTVVEHDYDLDGTRVRTRTTPPTGPPTTVDYLVDPNHQTSAIGRTPVLSQVVAETDAATSALAAHHVRGDDLLATLRPDAANPVALVAKYFHAEGIGTVRALTDELGAVSDRYDFEAFGELLAHQGTDQNAYLFAGEPRDPNSGFYYNRARWMQPQFGRFASEDVFQGFDEDPLSLHKYLYVGAGPVDDTDPTGLFEFSLNALAISMAVGGIVNTIAAHHAGDSLGKIVGDFAAGAVEGGAAYLIGGAFVRIAWKAAKYFKGAIQLFRFRNVAMVGFKSPIAPYNVLQGVTKGHKGAIQAHHILEQRHMVNWRSSAKAIREAPAQVLSRAAHTRISNALLKELPKGKFYTPDYVWMKYQIVYAEYPQYLRSIQHLFL